MKESLFTNHVSQHSHEPLAHSVSKASPTPFKKWRVAIPILVLAFTGIACSTGPSADGTGAQVKPAKAEDTESASAKSDLVMAEVPRTREHDALVAEARASADAVEKAAMLEKAGWVAADFSEVHVLRSNHGDLALARQFSRATEHASLDLVFTHDAKGAAVNIVKAADKPSFEVFKKTVLQPEVKPNDVACDPGCDIAPCDHWFCGYVESIGLNIACFSDANPFGAYFIYATRTGNTNTQYCTGLYADYHGNGISCPYPNSYAAMLYCGYAG